MQSDALSRILSEQIAEMKEIFATKDDLAQLRTELVRMEARLTWRMIAIVGFFGTVVTLLNAFIAR